MTKTELDSKHLAELHALAAAAGIDRYRMLSRAELIEKLAGGGGEGEAANGGAARKPQGERPKRRRRRRSGTKRPEGRGGGREQGEDAEEKDEEPKAVGPAPSRNEPPPAPPAESAAAVASGGGQEAGRPKRRRRRRFGRRKDQGVTLTSLLLPPEAGRQTVLCAESRETCTALLRGVAADLAGEDKGPDPIALLIDPSPEELADWKREAPQAEIVAAGQARHADDALAAAVRRAGSGEDVILLIDSLNRLGEAHGESEAAKEFFDSGRVQGAAGGGSLTVVAALERSDR